MFWLKRMRNETALHSQVLILCFAETKKETWCLIHVAIEKRNRCMLLLAFDLKVEHKETPRGDRSGVSHGKASCHSRLLAQMGWVRKRLGTCKSKFICVYSFFDSLFNWQRFMRDVLEIHSAPIPSSQTLITMLTVDRSFLACHAKKKRASGRKRAH